MIEPDRPSDIGRAVVQVPNGSEPRRGVIVNWTPDWVHVRYEGENFSRPELRENLEWADARHR